MFDQDFLRIMEKRLTGISPHRLMTAMNFSGGHWPGFLITHDLSYRLTPDDSLTGKRLHLTRFAQHLVDLTPVHLFLENHALGVFLK